ncbi:uncharacterized protein BDZ83DRAFT_790363 [Colletotrichum acutatum]|uniref:Uncharacterized protein n=1 Tax=Glomerella acutata TaxID=27357 RepID=A0AAD8USF3_GLOAC|nr:uncharacterized protein BDZ83DRAFT_790363 [Colletotrichum acutatum]KAK1727580.1 hypothetical protein BDZ83DRAFT_790363 [Colletotrichum acutatum]
MSQQDQVTPPGRPIGLQYSFGTSGAGHSFTWSPPTLSGSQKQLDHEALPHRKRRRLNEVQVNVEAHGVAKIRLGEDMTFDFTSNHREAKKQLSDVEAERDHLLQRLDETRKDHEKTLSKVKYERDESIRGHREATRTYDRITSALRVEVDGLQQELREANEDLEKAKQGLENAEVELERSSNASFDLSTESSPLIRTIRYLRDDHKEQLSTLKKDLEDSEDNVQAVSDSLKMRERELIACRDLNAQIIKGLRETNTKYISENGSLRAKVSELQDALKKQGQPTVIEL